MLEGYKTELELIYKNKKLEEMYCTVAKKAFKICKKYNRKSDFKKLCEVIRRHQSDNVKACEKPQSATNTFALNIKLLETNERLIDLRLTQLLYTQDLLLWQDAYKIMEDINVLLKNRKKTSNDLLLKYYQHLYEIFWFSNHYLLHAVCMLSHFACLRKKADEKDQLKYVNSLVLAAISVPKTNNEEITNSENFKKNCFLVNSVGIVMTREQLLANLRDGPYLDLCSPEVRSIFNLMTNNKDVLQFSQKVEVVFKKLEENPSFAKFLPLIEQNIIATLIERLSLLYKSLSFENFKKLIGFLDFPKCEKYLLYGQNSHTVKAQIDYEKGMLIFGHDSTYGTRVTGSLINLSHNISIAQKNVLRLKMAVTGESERLEKQCLTNARTYIVELQEDLAKRREERNQVVARNPISTQREEILRKKNREEEEKKQLMKQERLNQETDTKKLVIVMERVKGIIKMDKNAHYKGKKLELFTEMDFLDMDIDICIKIESEIKAKKQRQEEEKIEKQFKARDYLERQIRKKRYEHMIKQRNESKVDLEELKELAKKAHQEKLVLKEQVKSVAGFVKSFKDKLDKIRQQKYELEFAEYKSLVTKEFAQTVYSIAVKRKSDDEERKAREEQEEEKRKKNGT